MKRDAAGMVVGALCALVVGLVLFTFQVRQTEVGVVTTFGRFSRAITEPGWYARWFWPVQKVYRFDARVQNFERKFEQTTTADGRNLVVTVFVGWRVADARTFLERFPDGDAVRAAGSLEGLVRDAKNGVLGRYRFSDLISTNRERIKLREIEREMLSVIQGRASTNYGIGIELVGVKQFGLPESITSKVFDRMKAERQRLVKQFQSEGEAEAIRIRSEADRRRQELLAAAEAEAMVIRGQGEAEAARSFAAFEQSPELAVFLMELKALSASLKDRSTLVLDPGTAPFTLLRGVSGGPLGMSGTTNPVVLRRP